MLPCESYPIGLCGASRLVEDLNRRLQSYFSFPRKIARLFDRRDGVGL